MSQRDWTDFKRKAVQVSIMLLPAAVYFHKNRRSILKTVTSYKMSYYCPNDEGIHHGVAFHSKELIMRLFIGYVLGSGISIYFYGVKKVEVDAKTQEILADEDSLQYANYIKTKKEASTKALWYPGKIKD